MLNCKKLIALSMSAALALSLCACSKTAPVSPAPSAQETQDAEIIGGKDAQIPNPWIDCSAIADAAALAGFDFTAPDALFDGTASKSIQAIENDIIQVIYFDAENNEIGHVRKATGSEDVSGDYNIYTENETADAGGVSVELRGTDGKVFVMTWTADGYAYSVTAENGMSRDAALEMVSALK